MPDRWHHPSPRPSRRLVTVLFPLAFALLALAGAAPPDPVDEPQPPDTAGAIGARSGWFVSLAEPCRDTLAAPVTDVIGAAERCLEADDWKVDARGRARGDLRTSWKELRHPLAKILMGRVDARCAVAARPIEGGRTLVIFQGALASRESPAGNPAYHLAMIRYREAARDWQREVRGDLILRHLLPDPAR